MKIFKKLVLVAAAATAVAGLSGCQASSKTISCKDLFNPEFSGLSGSAKIRSYSRVNSETIEKIEKDFIGNVDTSLLNDLQKSEYRTAKNAVDGFLDSVEFTVEGVDDSDGYANGDQLQVTASFSDSYTKLMNIDVKDTTFTYTVQGVHEGTKINPFDKLKVSFSGTSPQGEIHFDSGDCPDFVKSYVDFYISSDSDLRNGSLKNGDKVTVKAEYSSYRAEEKEIIITEDTKEYTVSGLDEYPDSLDGVDLSDVNKKIEDKIKETINNDYKKGSYIYTDNADIKIDSSQYAIAKKYFRNKVVESGSYSSPANSYIVAYEISATGQVDYSSSSSKLKKGQTATVKKYIYVYTGTVTLDKDKKLIYDADEIGTGYKAYDSIDDLYKAISESSYYKYNTTEVK